MFAWLVTVLLSAPAHAQWQPTHGVIGGPIVPPGDYLTGTTMTPLGELRIDPAHGTWSWTGAGFPADGFAVWMGAPGATGTMAFANDAFDPAVTASVGAGTVFEVLACTAPGQCDPSMFLEVRHGGTELVWFLQAAAACPQTCAAVDAFVFLAREAPAIAMPALVQPLL